MKKKSLRSKIEKQKLVSSSTAVRSVNGPKENSQMEIEELLDNEKKSICLSVPDKNETQNGLNKLSKSSLRRQKKNLKKNALLKMDALSENLPVGALENKGHRSARSFNYIRQKKALNTPNPLKKTGKKLIMKQEFSNYMNVLKTISENKCNIFALKNHLT